MTPCYIGDEVSGAGFRLAGIRVLVPRRGGESAALTAARAECPLILVSAEVATRIPAEILERAQTALFPLTLVVPDLHERVPAADLAGRIRRELGLEATR